MRFSVNRAHTIASNRVLHLTVMPTERCNLRCVYCYEEFTLGRMSPGVVRGIENLLARRIPSLDQLTIAWFGGEPLLALDVIERVQGHALQLCQGHPGVEFRASMTTNATLLDAARFRKLLTLGVSQYQITLDGPPHIHDRRRVTAAGGGTYDRVRESLLMMREVDADFEVTVRLHIDRDNLLEIPGFIEDLQVALGGDSRFTVRPHALFCGTGPITSAFSPLDEWSAREAIAVISHQLAPTGSGPADPDVASEVCYAARANCFVIRSNGDLAKCTVALSSPENRVGRLCEDGRLDVDGERLKWWIRGLWTDDPVDLECPLRQWPSSGRVHEPRPDTPLSDPGSPPRSSTPTRPESGASAPVHPPSD